MPRRHVLLVGILALIGLPSPARAQEDACELLPGARFFNRMVTGDGRETSFISGPARFVCTGGITVESDSAVWTSGFGPERLELLGNVFYRDSVKTLTADRLIYLRAQDRLYAYGDVVLTDREGGAVVRGPELEHRGVRGESVERSRTIVTGGAHARLWPADSSAAPPDSTGGDPLDVTADRIEISGRDGFYAVGDVELARDSTRAYAEEADFERSGGRLILIDSARVVGPNYDLSARRIEATLIEQRLEDILAIGDAVLLSEETRASARRIRIFIDDGELNRMVAWHGRTAEEAAAEAPAADATTRAVIETPDIRLTGDSILVLAPGQTLERVVAVGRAYAERLQGDSAAVDGPARQIAGDSAAAAAPAGPITGDSAATGQPTGRRTESAALVALNGLPEIVRSDWIRGDTIIGYFAPDSAVADSLGAVDFVDNEADSTAVADRDTLDTARVELQRVVAIGGSAPASSIYHLRPAEASAEGPRINYVVASRISLKFDNGRIVSLEAEGPVQGIQLRPNTAPADSASGEVRNNTIMTAPAASGGAADHGSSKR